MAWLNISNMKNLFIKCAVMVLALVGIISAKAQSVMSLHDCMAYGISNSTSTLNKSVIKTLHSYGYASKSHWTKYLGGTPVSDSLINMKYIISNAETDNQVWELVHTDEDYNYYTYYNPYILSLAYAANAGLADLELSEYASCFEALNAVVSAACGRDVRIFTPLEVTNTDDSNITTGFTTQHRKYSKKDEAASARNKFPSFSGYCIPSVCLGPDAV